MQASSPSKYAGKLPFKICRQANPSKYAGKLTLQNMQASSPSKICRQAHLSKYAGKLTRQLPCVPVNCLLLHFLACPSLLPSPALPFPSLALPCLPFSISCLLQPSTAFPSLVLPSPALLLPSPAQMFPLKLDSSQMLQRVTYSHLSFHNNLFHDSSFKV